MPIYKVKACKECKKRFTGHIASKLCPKCKEALNKKIEYHKLCARPGCKKKFTTHRKNQDFCTSMCRKQFHSDEYRAAKENYIAMKNEANNG